MSILPHRYAWVSTVPPEVLVPLVAAMRALKVPILQAESFHSSTSELLPANSELGLDAWLRTLQAASAPPPEDATNCRFQPLNPAPEINAWSLCACLICSSCSLAKSGCSTLAPAQDCGTGGAAGEGSCSGGENCIVHSTERPVNIVPG